MSARSSNWIERLARFVEQPLFAHISTDKPSDNFVSQFEVHSLVNLLPYEVYDPDTQLYHNKKSVGFILEAAPLTGASEETVTLLSGLLTDVLPAQADFQCLLWASNKLGDVLQQFEQQREGQGDTLQWLAKQRADFMRHGVHHSLAKQSTYILRDFRLFFIVSLPLSIKSDVISELMTCRNQIIASLKSIPLPARSLPINEFIVVMNEWLSPMASVTPHQHTWQEQTALALQLTDPTCRLRIDPQRMVFEKEEENWEGRCYNVKDFPSSMTQWKMTDSIGQLFNSALQIPCPFLVSLSLRLVDQERALAKAQWKFLDKDKMARSPLAKFKPLFNREYEDWASVRARLAEGDRLVTAHYQVILYAPQTLAATAERCLHDLYRANGWRLCSSRYLQLASFLAAMPMMMTEGLHQDFKQFGRLRTMTAFNAMNIAPLQGEWKGSKTPSLLLPGRRGQLATWSPFDNTEGNYNMAIAAASGKGKSMFTQEYIACQLGMGGRVWVIDIGRSYEKTCHFLEGSFIEFKPDSSLSMNPFTFIKDFDASLVMLKPLLSAMARPNSKVSDEEMSYLEKALKAAWEEKGNEASITTVSQWLEKQSSPVCQNLSLLLYTYTCEGMYGRYFEAPCNIHLDNRFVVLELQELKAKKDLQRIILLVLMYTIAERMYLSDRSQMKSCIIDEAWDLLGGENDGAVQFIETGYRTARRYHANFVTITQSINDYFKNATSTAAFENSDYQLILGQKSEVIDQLKKSDRLSIDAFTERLLKSLRKTEDYSECVIKGPSGLSVHRILFDPYSRILYSSKGEEFEAVKQLQAQGHSLKDAIGIVAKRFHHVAE